MPGKKKLGGRGLSHGARQLQVATLSVAQLPLQGVPARTRVRPAHSDSGSEMEECDGSPRPEQGSEGNDDDDGLDSESAHSPVLHTRADGVADLRGFGGSRQSG